MPGQTQQKRRNASFLLVSAEYIDCGIMPQPDARTHSAVADGATRFFGPFSHRTDRGSIDQNDWCFMLLGRGTADPILSGVPFCSNFYKILFF